MPPWLSTTIGVAPWAAVAIVAITVGGRLLGKVLDIVKIWTMRSAHSPMAFYESKGEQWVWIWPGERETQSSGAESPIRPQLRSVDVPGEDAEPTARSG